MNKWIGIGVALVVLCAGFGIATAEHVKFTPEKDLLSLHYDHAPDRDDGHSAAADRTILESTFGADWIKKHVVAVSGTYGKNAGRFNEGSTAVMNAAWGRGGWLEAHADRDAAVAELASLWSKVLKAGGDVWVKEGGQSDVTADVVQIIQKEIGDIKTVKRIHVVQHSGWNERQTTDADLAFIKSNTHYIKIRDANSYLNIKGGDDAFVKAAGEHPVFGKLWKTAFAYFDPQLRLDFSDTGELMYILGIGEVGIDAFRRRFLTREN